jgi:hypothetical protein
MDNATTQKPDSEKDKQLWNEYQFLRDEVKTADTQNYQIIAGVVAAATLIFKTGFEQSNPLIRLCIFLSVYLITIPAYRLLQGNRSRTWRISTYLRIFLEPELKHINWESRLSAMRSKKSEGNEQPLSSRILTNEWYIVMLLNTIATIAAVFSLYESGLPQWVRAVGYACLGAWLIAAYFKSSAEEQALRRGGKVESGYAQKWEKLRMQEYKDGLTKDVQRNSRIRHAASAQVIGQHPVEPTPQPSANGQQQTVGKT